MRRRLPSKSIAHWSRLQVASTATRCCPTMMGPSPPGAALGGARGAVAGGCGWSCKRFCVSGSLMLFGMLAN